MKAKYVMSIQVLFREWCDQIICRMQSDDFDPLELEELVGCANSAFCSEFYPIPEFPNSGDSGIQELIREFQESVPYPFEVSYIAGHEIAILIRRQEPGRDESIGMLLLDADPTRQLNEQKSLLANVRVWKRWAENCGTLGRTEVPIEFRQEIEFDDDGSEVEVSRDSATRDWNSEAEAETATSVGRTEVDCPPEIQRSIDDWNAGEMTWKEIEAKHSTDTRTIKRYASRTGQELRTGKQGRPKKNKAKQSD